MAPMQTREPSNVSISRESLLAELANVETDVLKERGRRIAKSCEALEESLKDFAFEKADLQEENVGLQQAIELTMAQLNKLNIGAMNLNEPELEENPLNAVGRFWEMVKPRDTAVSVSEHIGEIKKPVPGVDGRNFVVHVEEQVNDSIRAAEDLFRTQNFFAQDADSKENVQPETNKAKDAPSFGSFLSYFMKPAIGTTLGRSSAGPGLPEEDSESETNPTPTAASDSLLQSDLSTKKVLLVDDDAEDAEELETFDVSDFVGSTVAAASSSTLDEPVAEEKAPEEELESSILIEARLALDDGEILSCRVRAADRCKEVAKRFVEDNALKEHFEAPLAAYLMQMEADADRFPYKCEANLMEIRQQYSKSS